jgi:hypothetical protein
MKRTLIACTVMLALVMIPRNSPASIITSAALGVSIGVLGGSMAMVLSNDPGGHTDYVTIGAGIGLACGIFLGISDVYTSFYHRETNREKLYGLRISLPIH